MSGSKHKIPSMNGAAFDWSGPFYVVAFKEEQSGRWCPVAILTWFMGGLAILEAWPDMNRVKRGCFKWLWTKGRYY